MTMPHPSFTAQVVNPDTGQSSARHLAGSIGGIAGDAPVVASTVSYEYDALGNRTEMTDSLGTVVYEYDELSMLKEETRSFTAITSRTFAIEYNYEKTGALKSVTNPFGQTVTYNRSKGGRLSSVAGSGYNYANPFVEDMKYRAWGALGHAEYGHGGEMNVSFDSGLRPTEYTVTGLAWNNMPYTRGSQYSYYADGQLRKVDDMSNDVFDKTFEYDHASRLKEAFSGFQARGETSNDPLVNPPYKQTYEYNAFGDRTGGTYKFWRTDMSSQLQRTFVNGRSQNFTSSSENDADGRPLGHKVNAAGRIVESISPDQVGGHSQEHWWQPSYEITQKFDGDGRIGYRMEIRRHDELSGEEYIVVSETTEKYLIRSTVLGGESVAEAAADGTQSGSYIYANGSKVAFQTDFCAQCPQPAIKFNEVDPLSGTTYQDGIRQDRTSEGAVTGDSDPWATFDNPHFLDLVDEQPMIEGVNAFTPCGFEIDGAPAEGNCSSYMNSGAGAIYVGGRYHGQVSLSGSTLGSGSVSIFIQDTRTDVRLVSDDEVNNPSNTEIGPGGHWLTVNYYWNFNWRSQRRGDQNCYTYYQMIYENPEVRKYMDELWEQTVASTKQVYEANRTNTTIGAPEFAGIVTIDVKNYKHSFYNLGGVKPNKEGLFDFSGPMKSALEQDKASGRNGRLLLEIHTHVPQPVITSAIGPYANEKDRPWFTSWDPNLVESHSKNPSFDDNLRAAGTAGWVGIAVWGKGKFALYGPETDIEKLKKMCVPGQSR